jgi:hypothetical protein
MPATRSYEVQYISAAALKSVSVNGVPATISYDDVLKTNHIVIPQLPIDQPLTIKMEL